ncbi:MAG: SPOR domain-containing protein [Nitrospinaceae bacterium]
MKSFCLQFFWPWVLAGAWVLSLGTAEVLAFSFGGIDIRSGFGERFDAEVVLTVEGDEDVQVAIGSKEDYRKLELERPRIVEELSIEKLVENQASRKIVHVVSKKPLFYPSFNLVLRGTQDGGTLLENYLITVDFRQSLALNVKGAKKKEPEVSSPPETVDLLQGGEAAPESPPDQEEKDEVKAGEEKSMEEPAAPAEPPASPEAKPSMPGPSLLTAPAAQSRAPSPLVGGRAPETHFPGATRVSPRLVPSPPPIQAPRSQNEVEESAVVAELPQENAAPAPAEAPGGPEPDSGANVDSGLSPAFYGPLKRGENLFSVTRKLNIPEADATRVVVALWMTNPDNFLYGNMNGLLAGARLNLESLEERLAQLDSRTAKEILLNQWQEWKIIQKRRSLPREEARDSESLEVPLPSEKIQGKEQIFAMLRDWKKSWEEKDLDGHMALFATVGRRDADRKYGEVLSVKKKLFRRHDNVRLRMARALLIFNAGRPVVSFGQEFSSNRMESFGQKEMELVREASDWKILDEKFRVVSYREMDGASSPRAVTVSNRDGFHEGEPPSSPRVIHASSHMDFSTATEAANRLRNQGFDAYSCPVFISRHRKIYRVYVGRFSGEDVARKLSRRVRGLGPARYAIPVRYPYSIQVGAFGSEGEAGEQLLRLRAKGVSPFLFTTSENDFSTTRFRVLVGAFARKRDAERYSRELKKKDISFTLVKP